MFFFKKKKNENVKEKQIPSAEQIIKDAENLRQDVENKEEDIPDIICAFYSATQNIDLDVNYVIEILNKSKNDNLNN